MKKKLLSWKLWLPVGLMSLSAAAFLPPGSFGQWDKSDNSWFAILMLAGFISLILAFDDLGAIRILKKKKIK